MAWLGKISNLGNLSDFAGAVNKLSESVKNIERNFDSALGFEARSEPSEAPPPVTEKRGHPTEPPGVPVIQTKDVTENGSSQAEPSLLNNVFGFARANFGSYDKAHVQATQSSLTETAPAMQPSVTEAAPATQPTLTETVPAPAIQPTFTEIPPALPRKDLTDSAEEISTDLTSTLESLTSSTAEITVDSQEIHDGEETTKSIPETNSAEVGLKAVALQQPPNLAPTENIEDGVRLEVGTAAETSTVEQQIIRNPGEKLEELREQFTTNPVEKREELKEQITTKLGENFEELREQITTNPDEKLEELREEITTTPSEKPKELREHEVGTAPEAVIVQQAQVLPPLERGNDPKEDIVDIPKQAIVKKHSGPGVPGVEQVLGKTAMNFLSLNPEPPSNTTVKDTYVIDDEDMDEETADRSLSGVEGTVDPNSNSIHPEEAAHLEISELPNGIAPLQANSSSRTEPPVAELLETTSENNELNKLKQDLKMMEAALHGAAKQSQMKADEISRLMVENDDLKNKTSSVELDALREEYQQRVGAAERKVYALTKERDMLRREQSRKSDSSILLKEKDEIIKQVMAEGEELSKKQAVQEGTMRKLRAQIRELEEEKQRLNSKLQVEEGKVESIRKDKAVTEAALQEAVERGQTELATLRDYYTVALNEAKEAEARAEARADSEAKADLDRRFRESAEREMALLQNLDALRQALSQTEQQAAFREDMHRSDMEDLEKRCQAAEARYEELVTHMPDSTRPLRRQIEALQESTAMRAEAWTGVERSLNSRLLEAEAKAAAAQERERAISERLSQTQSRVAVMEAQLSMLRAEQSQLTRSLEKERQRASDSRQEYLAATELATTLEGRAKQLEEEFEETRIRHKQELKEERARRHALEQEIDQEKAVIADYEKRLRAEGRSLIDKGVSPAHPGLQSEFSSSHRTHKRLPSVSSAGSVEENFMQASVDSDGTPMPRLSFSDRPPSPYVRGPGASLEQLEHQLRQKEGELSSYFQRLASLESTRDSLAEELVRASTQCESLRTEAGLLPGLRAELDSLRRRHTSALELMGERDEEVEELKADLADIKQMYREQITMLVGQIERLSATIADR